MRKSLPLLAGAIIVPLLAATVAAFAASGETPEVPSRTLPTASATSYTVATPTLEAPVRLAAPPKEEAPPPVEQRQAPAVRAADEPGTPTTTTTDPITPTTQVPPNEWATPAPTTPAPISPIPSGGPIEMAVSWDGLKCAQSDSWMVHSPGGRKVMCPGSQNP